MNKHKFKFDEKPAEVTRKANPDLRLKENHDNSAFRFFLVCTTWLLLLISRDGNGFFIAMAVLCVPLLRDYYMDIRSFGSNIQRPPRQHTKFKVYRWLTFIAAIMATIPPLMGLLGIIGVNFDYHSNAYVYIADNIFFNSAHTVPLSVFLLGTLTLPLFTLVDWFYISRNNPPE